LRASGPTPQLRGQLLLARIDYLREAHGETAMAAVLARLTENERQDLAQVARDGWYHFGLLVSLDRAIAAVIAPGDPRIFERLGEASARHRTEWLGPHVSLVSPHSFLSRVAEEHRRFHTFGRAAYRRLGFGAAELAFSEYPQLDESYCLSARGYIKGSVETLTGGAASVEERECQRRGDPACVFSIRWGARHDL